MIRSATTPHRHVAPDWDGLKAALLGAFFALWTLRGSGLERARSR